MLRANILIMRNAILLCYSKELNEVQHVLILVAATPC